MHFLFISPKCIIIEDTKIDSTGNIFCKILGYRATLKCFGSPAFQLKASSNSRAWRKDEKKIQ